MNLRHAPEPSQIQGTGSTLACEWVGHCVCGWCEPAGAQLDYQHALAHSLDHIAGMPDMWPEPPEVAA